ncbi:acetylornithine transaminase [Desulfobacca acetoxidans]|uniref:Acetylornithine aminotransferase n=1 Tax=Desulfobacca acetoxidans (strain ATCC 700848 / DSM 11109 / ASRB2) TaxID=880072 RepID=F2NDM2_DESAR|nr:acetylornithine transaminase [Desulfobacca acetoxidans]AEB10298.1 Acetylornithine/succinyldiaminopimelate aminotransferase [Desulfobacca acetoxidans DSM 11109]
MKTDIPIPDTRNSKLETHSASAAWMNRGKRTLMNTYARQPMVLMRGQGVRLWDLDGKEYLDFLAGIAVCNLGHAHPAITEAVCRQVQDLVHVSNLYHTIPQIKLAERLVELSFADRVFFCNSGAEANEGAIKLCRRYSWQKFGPDRYKIICAANSFHGRTLATLSATGQEKFWQGFAPLLPGFVFVPFNDPAALEAAIDNQTCGVLLEPVQGEGGVKIPTADYFPEVRNLCDKHNLLLILDEIQVGLGRTGRLFAHEHFGITPDIMTLAKGLANGLPIGALLVTEEVAAGFVPGTHASTFGGGPVVTAAALTVLEILAQPDFLAEVKAKGEYFLNGLRQLQPRHRFIQEVRGLGLILGIEIDGDGVPLVDSCREKGALINCTQGNVLRFLPPLVVSREEIDRFLAILDDVLP